jgi:secreted trypsin-like serine protease
LSLIISFFLYSHRNAASYVEVGEYDRTTRSDRAQFRFIEDQIAHPSYDPEEYEWDVMVMRLNSPVSKQYVHLNSDPSFPRESAELSVLGFGLTTYEKDPDGETTGILPDILQEATLNYVDNEECDRMYRSSTDEITSDMLCAAAGGRDACSGMLEMVACAHGLPQPYPFSLSKFVSL